MNGILRYMALLLAIVVIATTNHLLITIAGFLAVWFIAWPPISKYED